MHEMAVVTSIIDAVCAKADELDVDCVVALTLRVGEMRDIYEPLLQRYFDYFSKGTKAEGVRVTLETVPLRYRCEDCGAVYGYDLKNDEVLLRGGRERVAGEPRCIACGTADIELISGAELSIESIGVR